MSLFTEVMDYPCRVGMGVRQVTFESPCQIHEAMRSYRASLMRKGYSYTSVTTEYQKQLENGVTYALVNIRHFDHRSEEIACLPASYFIDTGTSEVPSVQKVEFLEDPFPAADL